MQIDNNKEDETAKLFDEIPHVTSPQYSHQDNLRLRSLPSTFPYYDMHGHGHGRGHGMDDVSELVDCLQSIYIAEEQSKPFALQRNPGPFAPKLPIGPSTAASALPFSGILGENPNVVFPHHSIPDAFPSSKADGFDPYWDFNALSLPARSSSPVESLRNVDLRERGLLSTLGSIYLLAKDKHGCSFLQEKLVEGRRWVDLIVDGVIGNISELMIHPFGNYLMQKLFPLCSEEQKTYILIALTEHKSTIIRLSMDSHGTRSMQKLIETLKNREQIALVMSVLRPRLLDLIKDINGNHVVQHCVVWFRTEDTKFIYYAATMHFIDIATHQHGCCVMQRCLGCSTGAYRTSLLAQATSNALLLSEDAYGNYVVQYAIGLKSPSVQTNFASQFEGNYVQLSIQKFGSNVVEKCFRDFGDDLKATIVYELLSVSQFEQLLQHPFANYVIHTALENTKGALYAALVGAIRHHVGVLRTSPYCKRIFLFLSKKNCAV